MDTQTTIEVLSLRLTEILPDPEQARDEGADTELADSIASVGVLQPIQLYQKAADPGPYFILNGERRYRGAAQAGHASIPAIVVPEPESAGDRLLIQVASNDGKRLKPMEEARTFKRILADKGWTIQQLAEALGRAKSTVSDRLAILEAPAVFHPLFASGVFTTAAAPLVRKYKDVPVEILEKCVAGLSKDHYLGDYVRTESPAPLNFVENALRSIEYTHARRVDGSVQKHYDGPTFKIGQVKFATDIPAYEKAREASYQSPATSSAAQDRRDQQESDRRRKEAAVHRKRLATRRAQFAALSAKLPTSIGGSANQADGWSQLLVDLVAKEVHADTHRVLCGQLQLTSEKSRSGGMSRYSDAVLRHARKLSAPERIKLVLQMLIAPDLSQPPYISGGPERFHAVAKLAKIDLSKVKVEDEKPAPAAKKARR